MLYCRFITGTTEAEQDTKTGKWHTCHNQLFMDFDGNIYLVPRNEITDGYTYPLGGKMANWDIRPAIGHDLECRYHQKILVKLPYLDLVKRGYVKNKTVNNKGIVVCKDIPPEFLEVLPTTFLETNARFKRMMEAIGLPSFWVKTMYLGVHLNVGWLSWLAKKWFKNEPKYFDMNEIYKEV